MIKDYEEKITKKFNIIKDLIKNKNIIKIIYKNYKNEKEIIIFGDKFVSNNRENCKILYNNQIIDLLSKFKTKNFNQLEIELNGILNITNMEEIFHNCNNLISLPDIHLINTNKVSNMNNLFCNCTNLSSLPDISNWSTNNISDMS